MKIVTLIENSAAADELAYEHGLSLYIETNNKKILVDAGQTDLFAKNAEILGIDLAGIDLAVLSHGHYDHSGGLKHFLQVNHHAPVYLSKYAFDRHYHGSDRYIGIDVSLKQSDRLIFTDALTVIDESLSLHSCNQRTRTAAIDSAGLTVLQGDRYIDDTFLHEQYLLIEENETRVLISGCSHKGILNIVSWFSPDVLVGGFHFMNLDPETEDKEKLRHAAAALMKYPTTYYTGHCTGSAQFDYMRSIMGSSLHPIHSGTVITL